MGETHSAFALHMVVWPSIVLSKTYGGLAEWSKAADLRSVGRLSARVRTSLPSFFNCAIIFLAYAQS